jgi:hypothetical protein
MDKAEKSKALTALRHMLDSRAALDEQISRHVQDLRGNGVTWSELGIAVGTTRQAAQIRWGKKKK